MDCGVRVAGCGVRVAGCELRGAGCGVRVVGYGLRVLGLDAGYWELATGYWLRVAKNSLPRFYTQAPLAQNGIRYRIWDGVVKIDDFH